MNLSRTVLSGLLILAAGAVAPVAAADMGPLPPDFIHQTILSDTEATGPLPAELVAAPTVLQLLPSSDGRYVLTLRRSLAMTPRVLREMVAEQSPPPPAALSLEVWDAQTHLSRQVWTGSDAANHLEQIDWLPQTHVALALIRQTGEPTAPQEPPPTRTGLFRILAAAGKMEPIGFTDPTPSRLREQLDLSVSPSRPVAVLTRTQLKEGALTPRPNGGISVAMETLETIYPLGADGRLGPGLALSSSQEGARVQWSPAGSPVLAETAAPTVPGQPPVVKWFSLDPKTFMVTPLEKAPQVTGSAPYSATRWEANSARTLFKNLRLTSSVIMVPNGAGVRPSALWLESIPAAARPNGAAPAFRQRVLLSVDAANGQFLADGSAVIYTSQGAAWAAPLLRVPRSLFDQARQRAMQITAESNARQLGLGLIMYAQDYDEVLPSPDGIQDKLRPYLKNDSLFDGFTYTYGGGKLSDITDPANTRLGYVTGPGGSAVIFADGHVKWEAN